MQKKLNEGPLHDAKGHLLEAGYATREVKQYDRAAVKAPWFRIKEWDYYGIFGEDFGLGLVVADNSYMGLLSLAWFDFRAGCQKDVVEIIPLTRGRLNLPSSADRGNIRADHNGFSISYKHADGGRILQVEAPGFESGKGFAAEIFLHQPPMDRMVIATPFPSDKRAFYYNQKINCLAAEGRAMVAGVEHTFAPDKHFGVLDWGRGVWAYNNHWYWGSASGLVGGRSFGFNIGYGFGDVSAASENMIFLDGRAHKLDQVRFHIPEAGYDKGEWMFTSNDGRFEMRFTPVYNRHDKTDLLILRSETNQTFGHFSGHVILDNGDRLDVPNLFGFAEDVFNRW